MGMLLLLKVAEKHMGIARYCCLTGIKFIVFKHQMINYMKKNLLSFVAIASASILLSCNNSSDSTTTTDSITTTTPSDADGSVADTGSMATTSGMSATPLEGNDKEFVIKAASGGIMEVEAGNLAQQNAASQRVKDFASMMVRDHTKANDELSSLASAKGLTINKDSIMNAHKEHLDAMKKMTGKAFDDHYVDMMVKDHKKTIADFEKASNDAKDADLKSWAGKTLPVLQLHSDSAQALNKAKL